MCEPPVLTEAAKRLSRAWGVLWQPHFERLAGMESDICFVEEPRPDASPEGCYRLEAAPTGPHNTVTLTRGQATVVLQSATAPLIVCEVPPLLRCRPVEIPWDVMGIACLHVAIRKGGLPLHGACFLLGGECVLALGSSGDGKSTLAAAAISAGGRVVSDDFLLVGMAGGAPTVVSLRSDVTLRPASHHILKIGEDARRRSQGSGTLDRQLQVFRREIAPAAFIDSGVPGQIWEVKVARNQSLTTVEPLEPADTLAVIIGASSPLYFGPGFARERRSCLELSNSMISRCRAFRILLGQDLLDAPASTVRRVLFETCKST